MEIYKAPAAIILMLVRRRGEKCEILCQRRQNTGFADGLWDFSCAGKVERGESMTAAAVREAKEELGINIAEDSLQFAVLVHKRDKECGVVYINPYFICSEFDGEPKIGETEKCSEIRWFDINNLPEDLPDDRRRALDAYMKGVHYIGYGWE